MQEIAKPADANATRAISRRLARTLGASVQEEWALAIAVSEAATNIIKFAGNGRIRIRIVRMKGRTGIEFHATDRGPGISDIDLCLEDGMSEGAYVKDLDMPALSRGRGSGLPAIQRLMDRMVIRNRPRGGVALVARKFFSWKSRGCPPRQESSIR